MSTENINNKKTDNRQVIRFFIDGFIIDGELFFQMRSNQMHLRRGRSIGSASAAKTDERGRIGRHDHRYPVLHILLGTCAGFYPGNDRRHSFGSRIKQKRALSFKRVCRGRIGSGYYRFGDRRDLYDSLFCGTEPDGIKNLNFQIKRQAFYACLFIMIKNLQEVLFCYSRERQNAKAESLYKRDDL